MGFVKLSVQRVLCSGNRFIFAKLLQKFLAGLKHSLSGDLTNHAVVMGLGKGAKSICEGLNGRYSHHCVQSTNWPGHDTEYETVSSALGKSAHLQDTLCVS